MFKKILIFLLFSQSVLCFAAPYKIGYGLNFAAGWENTGLRPENTWAPYYGIQHTQGSRKEAFTSFSFHILGTTKVFYSPFVSLRYGNTWSMAGSMNVMELNLALLGVSVYLSKTPDKYDSIKGKAFAIFDLNLLSISFGGNLTPNLGRAGYTKEWSDPNLQTGTQYYAFGKKYDYFKYSIPASIKFWVMAKENFGIGLSFASDVFIVEKSLNIKTMPSVMAYNVSAGLFFVIY